MSAREKFYLFDIDGTLLRVQTSFMKQLITEIIRRLGREEVIMDGKSFAGRTDRDIFLQLMQMNDVSEKRFDDIRQLYINLLEQNLTSAQVNSIDGVENALDFFAGQGVHIGLLTGNFRESAFIKLNRAGIDSYFEHGAFGCNHTNRNDLPELAYTIGTSMFGNNFAPSDMIIIGDTPKDVECAKNFGAVSVAVSTGFCSRAELLEHQPDLLLDSLAEPQHWIKKLN